MKEKLILSSSIDDLNNGETFDVLKTQTKFFAIGVMLENWLSYPNVTV